MCKYLDISSRTIQRWRKNGLTDKRKGASKVVPKKLSEEEVSTIYKLLCSNEYKEMTPAEVFNSLLDKGIYHATTTVSKTTDDTAFTNELTKTGDGTVTYASSKTDVATVNETTGEVTIVATGETVITATVADSDTYTYATKTASYTLTVTAADTTQQKSAGSISYATTTVSKTTDDAAFTNELTKTGDGTVSYASDNTAVATVNASTGEVTIVGAGTATITATVADSASYTYAIKTASYTVTVVTEQQATTYSITLTGPYSNFTLVMEYQEGDTWNDMATKYPDYIKIYSNKYLGFYTDGFICDEATGNKVSPTAVIDSNKTYKIE